MPVGRPTKYNEQMLASANEYIEDCPDAVTNTEGLALHLGVAVSTLYKWAEVHEAFSETLGQVQVSQKNTLINKGLKGEYNATIVKLMLANHGMHDKVDQTHAGPDGKPIAWEVLPVASNTGSGKASTDTDDT